MATYYVDSTRADDTGAGTSWATAKKTFGAAVALLASGDTILVSHTHQEELGADTAYTIVGTGVRILSVNKNSSDALTAMGTGGWIGNSTTNRSVTFDGSDTRFYVYGITLRTAGSTADSINLANSTGQEGVYEDCYLWSGNTASTSVIFSAAGTHVRLINCTLRFGNASQGVIFPAGEMIGGSVSTDGSAPSPLFDANLPNAPGAFRFSGVNLLHVTGTLVGNTSGNYAVHFDRCRLASGVTALATQTSNPSLASAEVLITDSAYSANGAENHGVFEYHNYLGSLTTDTGIYKTTNDSGNRSWKIVTSAAASYQSPFITPPIDVYHSGTSSITPYLEILRDGSTAPYKDNEVWADFYAKTTDYVTQATTGLSDRQTAANFFAGTAGVDQATGAGTGEWTGDTGAWSGKIDSGSAFTPKEPGSLTARVCVGVASATVYVDPTIRGLS